MKLKWPINSLVKLSMLNFLTVIALLGYAQFSYAQALCVDLFKPVLALPAPELIYTSKYKEVYQQLMDQPNVLRYIKSKHPTLTVEEIVTIRMYTSSYYQKLNPSLRSKIFTREFNEAAYYILRAMDKMPTVKQSVYRGVEKAEKEFLSQYKKGDFIFFGDFKSTSLMKYFAEDWTNQNTIIEFINTPAVDIKDISVLGSTEQEALVRPNHIFRVVDVVEYNKENYSKPFTKYILEPVQK